MSTTTMILMLATATTALANPPLYELQFLGQGFAGARMNSRGHVAGWVVPTQGPTRAHISFGGQTPVALPMPGAFVSSAAYDINDRGDAVGVVSMVSHPTLGSTTPVVWRRVAGGYEVHVLSPLQGDTVSYAIAINNFGDIVGGSGGIFGNSRGVLWTDAGPVNLTQLGSAAADINDHRVVLANQVLLDLDTMTTQTIDPPDRMSASGVQINIQSNLVGTVASYSSSCANFPARYLQGIGWEIMGGCSNSASGNSINDLNDVTSYYASTYAAWVHLEGEGDFGIAALVAPGQGAWYFQSSAQINNRRQIVIAGFDNNSTRRGAVLLSPIGMCRADYNGDGFVNGDDYDAFAEDFDEGWPGADMNHDGFVNGDDYDAFSSAFDAGC
ncbi:MAG: GC-type dockerin domain-anchored protein [Phycisphaerales bacterium]